jgi:protease-4
MPRDQVEKIAEGRVWDGSTALKLGLVDQLGDLEDALTAAAKLAGLEQNRASYIPEMESPAELLLKSLGSTQTLLFSAPLPGLVLNDSFTQHIARQYDFLTAGDPRHMYSHCLLPRTVPSF